MGAAGCIQQHPEPNPVDSSALQGAYGGFELAHGLWQVPGLQFLQGGWGQAGGAGLGALLDNFS